MTPKTYSVDRSYSTGSETDRRHWITIKGHSRAYQTDELLPDTAAVTLNGDRAERYFNHKDS